MATLSAQQFADYLNQKYPGKRINDPVYPGADIGDQWLNYYAKYKSKYSLSILEKGFADIIVLEDLKGGLTAALTDTSKDTNAAITGAAAGAIQAEQTLNPLNLFNWNNWILRIGEAILGIMLVGIGLNAALKNPVGKVAKATPAGKVL